MRRVLLVDAAPAALAQLQQGLRQQRPQCETVAADSGTAALASLARERFDAIVTDIDMPRVHIAAAELDPHSRRLRHVCGLELQELSEASASLPVSAEFSTRPRPSRSHCTLAPAEKMEPSKA